MLSEISVQNFIRRVGSRFGFPAGVEGIQKKNE